MNHTEGVSLSRGVETPARSGVAALGKRVLSAALLLPVFVWVVVFAPGWAFAGAIVAVGALAQWEFTRMFQRAGVRVFAGVGLVGGVLVTGSFALRDVMPAALTLTVIGVLTAALAWRRDGAGGWESGAVTLLGILYVNWLLGHAVWLRALPSGADWVLLLVWVTWIGETAAYLVGSTIGRRKLVPVISPRKTVEGALAQLLISPVAALAAQAWLFPEGRIAGAVAVGLMLGVVGQVGDLVESLLKRSVGIKDTGGLIPGHGGMLDRVDSLLFNTPVLFYYVSHGRALA